MLPITPATTLDEKISQVTARMDHGGTSAPLRLPRLHGSGGFG